MNWGSPFWLYMLWLAPLLAWGLFLLERQRRRRLEKMASAQLLPLLIPRWNPRRPAQRLILWMAALILCLLALARPQWGFRWEEVRRRGLDIMVVLDTSRSMLTEDIKPNRLQQAKWGIRDLVRQLKGDRLGLVAFAGASFLQCPLTIDYAAFAMTLDDVHVGIIPRGGTAIAQALRKAMDSFETQGEADRAIILITDGEDHEGTPLTLADELKKKNIRVYGIGIGTLEGELVPEGQEAGQGAFFKDRSGQVVKSALQEDVLQKLALATGGAYVRSAPGDLGLERVFRESIAQLKRDEQDSRMAKIYEERFVWLIGAAFLLLLVEAVWGRFTRAPREVST